MFPFLSKFLQLPLMLLDRVEDLHDDDLLLATVDQFLLLQVLSTDALFHSCPSSSIFSSEACLNVRTDWLS